MISIVPEFKSSLTSGVETEETLEVNGGYFHG